MNALTHHARFLRPLSSVLFATAYTTMAFSLSQTFLRFDSGAPQLSALLVALPLLVGVFLAGAALEPLHRPFALQLPGIRERQLRFAVLSTALAALVITAISAWAAPTVSPVASLGLVAALLASAVGTAAMWFVGSRLGSVDIEGLSATTTEDLVVDAPLQVAMPGMFVMWALASAVVVTVLALSDWVVEVRRARRRQGQAGS